MRAARLRRAQDKLYKRGAGRTSRSRTISLALVGKVRTLILTLNPGLSLSLGQTLTLTLTLTGQSQDEPARTISLLVMGKRRRGPSRAAAKLSEPEASL